MRVSQTFLVERSDERKNVFRSQVTATAHGAKYCGPSTVPPPMRDRPPQRGLRPPLLPNSVWVL